jgi:hypothetical protein
VEYAGVLIKQVSLWVAFSMGKRSSVDSKNRHAEKQKIKNTLLTYSFRDSLKAETVYTLENELVVLEQLKKDFKGFIPISALFVAEYGEVLTSPLGESPSLQVLMEREEESY